jgi:tellurite resistance protein TerC
MKYGLAGILIFVGFKMLISNFYHINVGVSLAVILGLLVVTIAASLLIKPKEKSISE